MLKKILEDKKLMSDIILITVLLVVSLSVFLVFFLTREEGTTVQVYVKEKLVAEYSLSIDATYYLNNGSNVLVIEDGSAYIKEATCPGYQDCVEAGRIQYVGQKIICLPNEVRIEIIGEGEGIDF